MTVEGNLAGELKASAQAAPEGVLLYTTWPDAETAMSAARTLVDARLAACANLLPAGRSIYVWQGRTDVAEEAVLLLKTTGDAAESLRERVAAIHPYEVPCILALPVWVAGSATSFLLWMEEQLQQGENNAMNGPQSGENA